jgi:chemotaxis methyl-accepting protein methylase
VITPDLVLIGSSTGGPKALIDIFSTCRVVFPFPIVIVNHFPKGDFTTTFSRELQKKTKLNVKEATDDEILTNDIIYLCPGGQHLTLRSALRGTKIKIGNEPPIDGCKPSIDNFFESASHLKVKNILAFILTGMGHDGVIGSRALNQKGHKVFTQEEASCTIYGMPKEVDKANLSKGSLTPTEISQKICSGPKCKPRRESDNKLNNDDLRKVSSPSHNPVKNSQEKSEKTKALHRDTSSFTPAPSEKFSQLPTTADLKNFKMTSPELDLLKNYLYDITKNQTYLKNKDDVLIEKMAPIAYRAKAANFNKLYELMKTSKEITDQVISATTVHESYFFRDVYPYRYLESELFPTWEKEGGAKSIWSSACANGQEIYSIAFTMEQYFSKKNARPQAMRKIKLYASDISTPNVNFSKQGLYNSSMLRRGLRTEQLHYYFEDVQGQKQVKNEYRQLIQFKTLNLLESLNALPRMDCIFCRYTLIYFSEEDQQKAIEAISNKLKKGGILILDSAMGLRIKSKSLESFNFERFKLFRKL